MSSTLTRDVKMTGVPKDKVDHIKTGLEQQGYKVEVQEEAGGTVLHPFCQARLVMCKDIWRFPLE